MAFKIYQTADGHMPPWEYLPAATIHPSRGLALILDDGLLSVAAATDKPQFICMREGDEDEVCNFGDMIPVIRVSDDIIFETKNNNAFDEIYLGDKVTLKDGLFVTATTTNGVATVVDFDGCVKGSRVHVKF